MQSSLLRKLFAAPMIPWSKILFEENLGLMRREKANYLLCPTYNTNIFLLLVKMEKTRKRWTIWLLRGRGDFFKNTSILQACFNAPKENLCTQTLLKKFMNAPSLSQIKACYKQKKCYAYTHPQTKISSESKGKLYQITHYPFKMSNGPPIKELIQEKKEEIINYLRE